MVFIISYDLMKQKDYDAITAALESPPQKDDAHSAHKMQLSLWLVDTKFTKLAWRDHLVAATDEDDRFLITRVEGPADLEWNKALTGTKAWLGDESRRW